VCETRKDVSNASLWNREFIQKLNTVKNPEEILSWECLNDEEEIMLIMLQEGFEHLGFKYVGFSTEQIPWYLEENVDEIYYDLSILGVCLEVNLGMKPHDENFLKILIQKGEEYNKVIESYHITKPEQDLIDGTNIPLEDFPSYNKGLQLDSWKENIEGINDDYTIGNVKAVSDLITRMNFREIHTVALIMEHLGMAWSEMIENED